MTKNDQGLNERQIKAIPFLVAPGTYEQARKEAGVSKDRLYKWLKDPNFVAELKRQRDAVAVYG